MKRLLLVPLTLLAAAALPHAPQERRVTTIFELVDHTVDWPAPTRDGRRIYYQRDSTEIYMYDRASRAHTRIGAGEITDAEVSPAGDRLVFVRKAEDSDVTHVWTLALDSRTGLAAGNARRVSMSSGFFPSFSPDGRSVAFAAGPRFDVNDLIVVPAAGGPERVVVQTQGTIWPVRWSADGQWLYYGGSNMSTRMANAVSATFRVPAAGGTPQRVLDTAAGGANPGLSPDGRVLITWSTGWDSIVVSTPEGRRIAAWETGTHPDPQIWIDGTRALSYGGVTPRSLTLASLADGRTRVVVPDSARGLSLALGQGRWSPDGRRFATYSWSSNFRGVVILDEGGSTQRIMTRTFPRGLAWSPDGQRIAYRRAEAATSDINVLELAGGRERVLAERSSTQIPLRWTADGQGVIYGLFESEVTADSSRWMDIRLAEVAGGDRSLGRVLTKCSSTAETCFMYLSDSTILNWSSLEYRVATIAAGGPGRLLLTRGAGPQAGPSVSENGRWIAVREPGANNRWSVHVLAADGSSQRRVALPVPPLPGGNNPFVSDDGSELIYKAQPASGSGADVYRLNVATGAATRLRSLPEDAVPPPLANQRLVSPGGRNIVFGSTSPERRAIVLEIDLSETLRSAPGARP